MFQRFIWCKVCRLDITRQDISPEKPKDLASLATALKAAVASAKKSPDQQSHALPSYVPLYARVGSSHRQCQTTVNYMETYCMFLGASLEIMQNHCSKVYTDFVCQIFMYRCVYN